CSKKLEIFQCLARIGRLVSSWNHQRIVKLKSAFAPPLGVHTSIFTRKRKVAFLRDTATSGFVHRLPEALGLHAARYDCPPGLAVAPRCGLLRDAENAQDRLPSNRGRLKGTTRTPSGGKKL